MKTTAIAFGSLLALVVAPACVSKNEYDQAVAQTQTTRAQLGRTRTDLDRTTVALNQTTAQLEQARAEEARLEMLIAEASKSSSEDRAVGEMRIDELRKRLQEVRSAHAAAEARAMLFRQLAKRLEKQVDAGDLTIVVRDGRMVLRLPDDVLFDTGRTELKPAGKDALRAIAAVLASMPDRQFQVAGHTDNVPIHNAQFASNWELSTARALRVVHFLVDQNVPTASLSAAGYGQIDPVSENTSPEGRRSNRRTEITLQPNIDELVPIP